MNIPFYIFINVINTILLAFYISNTIVETQNKNRVPALLWYFGTTVLSVIFYNGVIIS